MLTIQMVAEENREEVPRGDSANDNELGDDAVVFLKFMMTGKRVKTVMLSPPKR